MKYKATFTVPASVKKETFESFSAKASVDDMEAIKSLLPSSEEMAKNEDVLHITCSLANVNWINQNQHGIQTSTALSIKDKWKYKFINLEHSRQEILGTVTNAGFCSFDGSKMLSDEDVKDSSDIFNICISGIVWKAASPWMSEYIKDCGNPESGMQGQLSASWELSFDEFYIALDSKVLSKAEIITDEAEVKKLSKYLVQMGGKGITPDNRECFMVIAGDVKPLGLGLVRSPAAAVSGILCIDPEDIEEEEEDEDEEGETEEMDKKCKASAEEKKVIENKNKISQPTKITVKRINLMKFKDIDEFVDKYQEAVASNQAFATSDVREFIKDQLVKSAEGWQSKVDEQLSKAAAAEKKVTEMQAAIDVAKDDAKTNAEALAEIKKELNEVRAQAEEAAKRQIFDSRMSELDEKYDLSDKVRKVIIKSIASKNDEEYADWLSNEGEVILAGKEKKAVTVEEALKEVKASAEILPNVSAESKEVENKPLKSTIKPSKDGFTISIN